MPAGPSRHARAALAILRRVANAVTGWRETAAALGVGAEESDAYRSAFDTAQLEWALSL